MPEYVIEHREIFDKSYLKVELKDNSNLDRVHKLLNDLQSTHNVNITKSKRTDITVYPSKFYTPKETEQEIRLQLDSFFKTHPLDPTFEKNKISNISEKAYREIIQEINIFGHNLEKYKSLHSKFDEEGFRDFFLPHLNSISKNYSATGETFNKIGKTDILIQDGNGVNVFIAECKIWHGVQELSNAIDQLLIRYVNWRDERTALIIFNKNNQNFTQLINSAKNGVQSHACFHDTIGQTFPSSISYIFRNPEDNEKKIFFELIIFNCA